MKIGKRHQKHHDFGMLFANTKLHNQDSENEGSKKYGKNSLINVFAK